MSCKSSSMGLNELLWQICFNCIIKTKLMKIKEIYLISILVFIFLVLLIPDRFIEPETGNTILTIGTFLFGLLAGFYIVVTTTDYNNLKSILAKETASWDCLYKNMRTYNKETEEKLSNIVDEYVQRNFDYELLEVINGTAEEFKRVEKIMEDMPIIPDKQSTHQVILGNVDDLRNARQQQNALLRKALSAFQWIVLISTATLVIWSLFGLRTGALFFDAVTVLISSSIVLILLLIRDIDLYLWNEKFGFDIFEDLLKNIGKLPYYPSVLIDKGRLKPKESEYRVGVYKNFPQSLEKTIEIIKN